MIFLKAFFLLHFFKISQQTSICPLKQHDLDLPFFTITDFNSFKELNFTDCDFVNVSSLEIQPNRKQVLDRSLNFTGLAINQVFGYIKFVFTNIKGIDTRMDLFSKIKIGDLQFGGPIILFFQETNFNFYYKTKLIDKNLCNLNLFNEITLNKNGFMKRSFSFYLKKLVNFSNEICPFLFQFANITVFDISAIKSSFLYKNTLTFMDLNWTEIIDF